MQTNHASAIKGLSIAVIVLAALGIIGSLIGSITMAAMAPYMEYALEYDDGYYGYSDESIIMQMTMAIGGAMFGWALVCCILVLIAGIMGLRNYNNPQKMGTIFGWSVAGAILSFLGCSIITCVLLIIVAVFASKDKQLYATGTYSQVTPNAVPVQPAAAPVPPVAAPAATPVPPAATTPAPVQQPTDVAPVVGEVQVTETIIENTNPTTPTDR